MGVRPILLHIALTIPLGMVSLVHIVQSIMVLTDDVGTTSIIGLAYNHAGDWVPLALGETVLAIAYLVAAGIATVALFRSDWSLMAHIVCWFPQQVLVGLAAVSAIEAMVAGCYLDGVGCHGFVDISREHVIADQVVYPILAIAHFISFWAWRWVVCSLAEAEARVRHMVSQG